MRHQEINFSPYSNNVLDYTNNDKLETPDGNPVNITQSGLDFIIVIGHELYHTNCNLEASYILNTHQVGIKT